MTQRFLCTCLALLCAFAMQAQKINRQGGDPKLTEVWEPAIKVITPGKTAVDAPSDAIVLFSGQDANAWAARDNGAAKWKVEGGILTVAPGSGEIHTKEGFGDCQLHIEWRTPAEVKGDGQG